LRNIVILHSAALGDFVLSWPLGLGLARAYAQHRVIYVTHPSKGQLAESVLGVEWRDESLFTGIYGEDAAVTDQARAILSRTWAVIALGADPQMTRRLAALAPQARLAPLTHRPPDGYHNHVSWFHLEQLTDPMLRGPAELMLKHVAERGLARGWASGPVVIHPGSGSASKNWPVARFAELASVLVSHGLPVTIVVGEVERDRFSARDFDQLTASAAVRVCDDLRSLHETLLGARAYVGNDSGPSHLAAMLGLPTVALFGASDPVVWSPVGPTVRIVRGSGMDSIAVSTVMTTVLESIPD
jgi:ADP-heptose:LPS heptosyltransferase